MPPITRAAKSAPVTPDRPAQQRRPSGIIRKTPCCSVCHRPRKGHPRQGCPFVDGEDDEDGAQAAPARLTQAMGSMAIHPNDEDDFTLSSPSRPYHPEAKANVRRLEGRIMPGTLYPPRDSFFESPEPPSLQGSQKTEFIDPLTDDQSLQRSKLPSRLSTPGPARTLVRSATVDAREDFLDDISHLSNRTPVSVYAVRADDVVLLASAAHKLGFVASSVLPQGATDRALLIIGIDGDAVEDLRLQISKKANESKGCSFGTLVAVAGGLLAGAVATIAGLSVG
jgi:hypothetical protein